MRKPVILIVDDDPAMLRLLYAVAYKVTSRIFTCSSADEAMQFLQPCDMLITDNYMPGRSGIELARLMCQRYPEKPVILVSGLCCERLYREAANSRTFRCIEKGQRMDTELLLAIQSGMFFLQNIWAQREAKTKEIAHEIILAATLRLKN
jgi:DNA-binding NtrC family response regulator